jgi:hypothetical protein
MPASTRRYPDAERYEVLAHISAHMKSHDGLRLTFLWKFRSIYPMTTIATGPSMLLGFSASNVRSFRDTFGLSLLATRVSEAGVARSIPWRDGGQPIDVLPTALVLGSNASGKSNLLRAMADLRKETHSAASSDARSVSSQIPAPRPRRSRSTSYLTASATSTA